MKLVAAFLRSGLQLIILFFAWTSQVYAMDASEVYTIEHVEVSYENDDPSDAKMQASTDVVKKAFTQLMERILPQATLWKVKNLSSEKIQESATNISVESERITHKSYLGKFSVTFDPTKIRALLNRVGAVYDDKPAPLTLVIPMTHESGNLKAWDFESPLIASWNDAPLFIGISAFVYPEGGLSDIVLFNAEDADAKEFNVFQAIANKYKAEQVLLVISDMNDDVINNKLKLIKQDDIDELFAKTEDAGLLSTALEQNVFNVLHAVDDHYKGLVKANVHKKFATELVIQKNLHNVDDVMKKLNMVKSIIGIKKVFEDAKIMMIEVIYIAKPYKFANDLKSYDLVIKKYNDNRQEIAIEN